MKLFKLLGGLALGGLIFAGAASAQTNPPAPTEVKTVGDWHVRCYQVSSPMPCSMQEILSQKGSDTAVLIISIAYNTQHKSSVAQIGVPLGVALAKGLTILADDYTAPVLRFHRCSRNFCFVETLLPDEVVSALSHSTNAKIRITMDNDNKSYNVPYSLKGFSEAHDALVQFSTQKGSKAAPAPAPADQSAPQ
jgi:invasion protein IalB